MRTGHLFAGIDGLGLGLEGHGFEAAWFSEYEAAPSRLLAHHYPDVPNHGDITQIDWTQVEPVDALTGGFPCQDISKAGKGAGIKEGTRSGLWFSFADAIRHLRPRLVVIENVSALASRGGDIVLGDLAALGFDAWWTTVRASDVGAAHRRERLFIVAVDADGGGRDGRGSGESATSWDRREGRFGRSAGAGSVAADGDGFGCLHGEPGVEPAEAGFDALRDAPAGGHPAAAHSSGSGAGRDGGAVSRQVEEGGRARADVHAAWDGREVAPHGAGDRWPARRSGPGERQRDAGLPTRDLKAPADADRSGRSEQRGSLPDGTQHAPAECASEAATDWGEFEPAVRRWERVLGRPAPVPTDDQGRLSPDFVEWHMGFPEGWTAMLSRNERLKALGNAVVPQVADLVGRWALELVEREVAA